MEFTEEQELEIQKRIEEAQNRQLFADNGDAVLTRCEAIIEEEVNRGYVKKSELQVLKQIHYLFRVDVGLEIPQKPQEQPKET